MRSCCVSSTTTMAPALRCSLVSTLTPRNRIRIINGGLLPFRNNKPSSLYTSSSSHSLTSLHRPKASSIFSTSRSMSSEPPPQATQAVSPGEVDSQEDNVFQMIQSHQESAARLPPIEEIRTVLDRSIRGTLSTFSQKYQGYPSGSMVDFACDTDGTPVLAVSSLAVHTKDLLANPKCSLLVARDPEDRTDLIITVHGDAQLVPEKDVAEVRTAYLRRHPKAFWVDFGDFQFMRIEPKVVRYVSGVATALLGSGEFSEEEYKTAKVDPISQFSNPVTSHMNKDHSDDTKAIVQHSTKVPVDFAFMLDLDSLGFNVKAGYRGNNFKLRIPFPRRAEDRKDVKTLIVEMLQAAKAST